MKEIKGAGELYEKDLFGDLGKSAESTEAKIKRLTELMGLFKEAAKATQAATPKDAPTSAKGIEEVNKKLQESINLAKLNQQADAELKKEKIRLSEETKKHTAALKLEVQQEKAAVGSINEATLANKKLREEVKNLNLTTADGIKRRDEINAAIKKNTDFIRANSDEMTKQKMNIGNYGSALDGLKLRFNDLIRYAGQFGLALGGVAIIRGAFNVIKDFDQGVANLASVLGKTREQVVALEADAKRLGATTSFTATQVAELQTEFAKLGFTEAEILAATEATLNLAAATGSDLARAAEVAGATVRGMGLTAEDTMHVTDVMASSFSKSALDMEKFAESMKLVAPIANSAGVSLEETTAMLGALANAGISGSNAGTALRRIISEIGATGKPTGEALKELAERGLDLAGAEDEVGKNAMSALLILSKQTEQIGTLTKEFQNADGAAKEMADTQLNTVGGAIALLQSAWEGFILKMNDASGAGSGLTKVIKFLADNLDTIMTVIGKLIKIWIAYRVVLFSLKMADRVREMLAYNKAVKDGSVLAGQASEGVKRFGQALKGIGLSLAIGLVLELAQAFYRIASGAEDAERRVDNLNKAVEHGSKVANTRLDYLRDEVALRNITLEQQKELIRQEVISLKNQRAALAARATQLASSDAFRDAAGTNAAFRTLADVREIAKMEAYKNKLAEIDASLGAYNEELKNIRISEIQMSEATEESEKSKAKLGKEIDRTKEKLAVLQAFLRKTSTEYVKLREVARLSLDPNDVEAAIMLEKERENTVAKIALLEAEIALSKAQQSGDSAAIATAEERVMKAKIEAINAQLKLDLFTESDPAKRLELEKQAELEILNLKQKQIQAQKNYYDEINKGIELSTRLFEKNADKRIAKIDEEMEAQKRQADQLRELAAQGNITAKESLAEADRLVAESQFKRQQEERRKQQVLMASALIQSYNSNLAAGDDSTKAFAKAITSKELLEQVIDALPAFFDGIENTGENGRGIDGRGGFVSILHPNERVMTAEQNAKIGDYSNNEVAEIMQSVRLGKAINTAPTGWEGMAMMSQLNGLKDEMRSVREAIENKPETEYNVDRITSSAMTLVRNTKQGSRRTVSTYIIKP